MPVSVALSFPSGRFHATPWGHHVNEALPEWPPSPWRLLRALVAVWKRKRPDVSRETVEPVLLELVKTCPAFHLPPATLGHTRHYMPLSSTDESQRTKVFDAFVALKPHAPSRDDAPVDEDAEVVFHWPTAELTTEATDALRALLGTLSYFGRAESWCIARLLNTFDIAPNCEPGPAPGKQVVRVLAADPETWNRWDFKDKKIVPPDPAWNLLAETSDLHLERWSDPPGTKWVNYGRTSDCFAPRMPRRPTLAGDTKTDYVVARFAIDVAEGSRPLPLVTETLPFAEEVRRRLGREYAAVVRGRQRDVREGGDELQRWSPIIHGKDATGSPARSHDHAFYLPRDDDHNRDGRIDHLTVFASGRFSRDDLSALDRLRAISFGKEGEAPGKGNVPGRRRTTHRLLLVGLDRDRPADVSVFGPASVWVSATPYIAYRHFKPRGRKRDNRAFIPLEAMPEFMKQILREDWEQRRDLAHLPQPEIEFLVDPRTTLGWRFRSLQFRRGRNRPGDDGYSRPFGAFRLSFPEVVSGPIGLGYACHFGMGAFRPD